MFKKLAPVLVALLLTACASQGQKIDGDVISKVKKGQTTEQEIVTLLGNPTSTGVSSDGSKQLTYTYTKTQASPASYIPFIGFLFSGVEAELQILSVTLDKKRKVLDYNFSSTFSKTKMGVF